MITYTVDGGEGVEGEESGIVNIVDVKNGSRFTFSIAFSTEG